MLSVALGGGGGRPLLLGDLKGAKPARLLVLHTKLVSLRRNGVSQRPASESVVHFYELSLAVWVELDFFFFFLA